MYEFVDTLIEKRRFLFALASIAIYILLTSVLGAAVQAHRTTLEARIKASDNGQSTPIADDSPNVITNALTQLSDDIGGGSNTIEVKILKGTMAVATGLTSFNGTVEYGGYAAVMNTAHGIRIASLYAVHSEETTMRSTAHFVSNSASGTADATGSGVNFAVNSVSSNIEFNMNLFRSVGGFAVGVTHVASIIRPTDATPVPKITQLRLQQAKIIQTGTQDVTIAAVASGSGGACDVGDGNGGYPISWCSAPMDTVSTVSYTSDLINRECTSYAFWYFTAVEGHANFQVFDDAKYWASTSNYPSHALPQVGAIAVETAGAYGHVAIVQALSGQKYDGQVVPDGDLLVSEMNYDWQGHFRYSYSPESKFSAYIY
jgi:surface antigen